MSKPFVIIAALAVLVSSRFAVADEPSFRADRKITGEYFRPYTAHSYQQGAMSHAETLEYYGRHYRTVPAETKQEHVAEICRNLDAAKKELAKLGKEATGDKKIAEHLKAIEGHYAKAEELANQLGEESADGKAIAACCVEITKELKAAETEYEKLKKTLGLDKPAKKAK